MASTTPPPRKAVVVGAGPVGCLSAISLAKMGWTVEIYEGRPDMRLPSSQAAAQQRSINLAMSARGIAAIEAIEPSAADRFLKAVIPMHGRMIHDVKGNQESQLYDKDGQCINSIGRAFMNEDLLTEALAITNIRVFFKYKVLSIDFNTRVMTVRNMDTEQNAQVSFDFCVGSDGSYSVVRRQLMRVVRCVFPYLPYKNVIFPRFSIEPLPSDTHCPTFSRSMDYQQEYIPHEYLELKMPAGPPMVIGGDPTFLLDPNHLHIWPRHTFMLIALPNKDKTFTCTLFAPTVEFDRLNAPEVIIDWFRAYFPDALPLIGEKALLADFERNPRSSLMSIKANPYHYRDCAVILGDAAHAMVPFYGQGLNCGLEDVRVLDVLLRTEGVNPAYHPPGGEDSCLARALAKYSEARHVDLASICDLAMDNYVEMRHSVTTPTYHFYKALDNILYGLTAKKTSSNGLIPLLSREPFPTSTPSGWLPLYTMVTFRPDISYSTAKRVASKQRRILKYIGWVNAAVGAGMISVTCMAVFRRLYNRG